MEIPSYTGVHTVSRGCATQGEVVALGLAVGRFRDILGEFVNLDLLFLTTLRRIVPDSNVIT